MQIKEHFSPLWMETLVISNVKIYGNIQAIKKNPPQIVIEIWNKGPILKKLIGRRLVIPHVFLDGDKLQPPAYPPKPEWLKITSSGEYKGEILAMFEIVQERGGLIDVEEDTVVTGIPDYIKLPTIPYKLEILFWGVRRSKNLPLSSLTMPNVTITCGQIEVASYPIKNPSSFPNFKQPLYIFNMDLPMDWHYAPPVVIRLFDNRTFGRKVYIGNHIVRNLNKFVVELPTKVEWDELRASRALTVFDTFSNYQKKKKESNVFDLSQENKPLIEMKEDVESKKPLMSKVRRRRSRWWTYICWCWRKRELDEPGYISLGLISSFNDPESDEEFFDWWTKYFDSLDKPNPQSKEAYLPRTLESGFTLDIDNIIFRRKTPGIEIYSTELENQPEFEGFSDVLQTFLLTKVSSKTYQDTGRFKGCIALYKNTAEDSASGDSLTQGPFFGGVAKELGAVIPLTIRVYVIRAHQLHSKDKMGKVNAFIEVAIPSRNQLISDSKNFIRQEVNPIFGKFYEVDANLPYDSTLVVRVMDKKRCKEKDLIGETVIDIENRYYSRHRGTCGLQRAYATEGYNAWRDVHKPTEILSWLCQSNNIPLPEYSSYYVHVGGMKFTSNTQDNKEINETLALAALLNWEKVPKLGCKLLQEHVETRSLYLPHQSGVERGKLEMWIDILPGNMELPLPVDIRPRTPELYELRAIVWSTRDVKLVDDGALVGKKNTDIYVKGWLKGKEDVQKTDVHFASLTGEGFFNWRFVYGFFYDRQEQMIVLDDFSNKIPPVLYLQVWDRERIHPNEYIGCLSLDLRDVPSPARKLPFAKVYVPKKSWNKNLFRDRHARGWWTFIGEKEGLMKSVGMVDLELLLLTSVEAERFPAGKGRNEPDALPDPLRPIMKYTIWVVPFIAIKNYLWRYHKTDICLVLSMFIASLFVIVFFYSFPNYTVKKIMNA